MPQPTLKYTYFDLPARGEPCRLALVMADIPFTDDRIAFGDFPALRPTLPLGSVPVMEIDGARFVQSTPILRYIGSISGLYPVSDPIKALHVDQVIDTVADFFSGLLKAPGSDKEARLAAVKQGGERYLAGCQRLIEAFPESSEGPFVLGKKPSIADAHIAGLYNLIFVEFLDFVPPDAIDQYTRLMAVHDAVMKIPSVVKYHEKHPLKKVR